MTLESKPFAVAVCGKKSLFTHTTESPTRTVRSSGLKVVASMTTLCVAGLAAGCAVPGPMPKSTGPSSAARSASEDVLLEAGLDLLGMLEMRHEGRARLFQQGLELGVLGAGDEGLVDRVEHGLVVGDLVVDVRLVELGALQPLELGDVLVAAFLQGLAGRVVLRLDLQLGGQVGRRLVDARVVRHHLLAELLDVRVGGLGGRQLASVDVDLVGGD